MTNELLSIPSAAFAITMAMVGAAPLGAQRTVDLMLCDLEMPGIDGFKLLSLKQSRGDLQDVPVILLTGQEDVKAKVRGLEAGAADYLVKPFHDEELVARVRVHLKLKQLQDELREKNFRLEELTRVDDLTKVTNRRYLLEQLDSEFKRAERYDTALARKLGEMMSEPTYLMAGFVYGVWKRPGKRRIKRRR